MKLWKGLLMSLMVGLFTVLFMHSLIAQEAEFKSHTTERIFWINDSECSEARATFQTASKMWNFYAQPRLLEIENPTDLTEPSEYDGDDFIECLQPDNMVEKFNDQTAANTTNWVNNETRLIYDSDLTFSTQWMTVCTMLHELGHAIGLAVANGHPDDPIAVMYYQVGCHQNFLTTTDLIMAADIYEQPANCTPYIQDDWSIYWPNIAGWEAETVWDHSEQHWVVLWFAPAPSYTWKCDLTWSKSQYFKGVYYINTQMYDDGKLLNKQFALEGKILRGL